MSERPEHREPRRGEDDRQAPEIDPLAPGTLARCAADGELTPEQARALSQGPGLGDQIAFERELRSRAGQMMREPRRAPESVRDELVATMRAASADAWLEPNGDRVGPASTRQRSFWARPPVWLAAAAALAVAATTLVLTRSPLTSEQEPAAIANAPSTPAGDNFFVALASFVTEEHDKCSDFQEYFQRKMEVTETAAAESRMVELLGKPPTRIQLNEAGYRFTGMGDCRVPGPPSTHLLYAPLDASGGALSLFVQKDGDHLDIEEGVCYALSCEKNAPVLVWKRDGLIYYLFCPDPAAEQRASRALGAPERLVTL